MKKIILISICLGIVGCAYASRMNQLNLGMTKADVLKIMGTPNSTEAEYKTEILEYRLLTDWTADHKDPFWIFLEDGKVIKYGPAKNFSVVVSEEDKLRNDERNAKRASLATALVYMNQQNLANQQHQELVNAIKQSGRPASNPGLLPSISGAHCTSRANGSNVATDCY